MGIENGYHMSVEKVWEYHLCLSLIHQFMCVLFFDLMVVSICVGFLEYLLRKSNARKPLRSSDFFLNAFSYNVFHKTRFFYRQDNKDITGCYAVGKK